VLPPLLLQVSPGDDSMQQTCQADGRHVLQLVPCDCKQCCCPCAAGHVAQLG
jgi:hypothetical protein